MKYGRFLIVAIAIVTILVAASIFGGNVSNEITQDPSTSTTFAVIGDYGSGDANADSVAKLVKSWNPTFILSVGDGSFTAASGIGTGNYHISTEPFYGEWLKDKGFFPCLGNHDYDEKGKPDTYLNYFNLPGAKFKNSSGNERFYDFVEGPVHFFVLNSNSQEPSGTASTSAQAKWLQEQLAASDSPWNVVYDHHPPYSSDEYHGSSEYMQWPFAEWGADAVISGHAHTYQRIMRDGIVYFVNGLGGAERYGFTTPVKGTAVRYSNDWGAQKVVASDDALTFKFYNTNGKLIDSHQLVKSDQ